jgi:NAD+ synthase (glutamine-hydrolysing)
VEFRNIYDQGFARVAARVLPVKLADPMANARAIVEDLRLMNDHGVAVAAYPELSLTGYSCGDLFLQDTLLDAVEEAVVFLREETKDLLTTFVVGAPVRSHNRVYNCALVFEEGTLEVAVPKIYLPNYREFYERRWFASGADLDAIEGTELVFAGEVIDIRPHITFLPRRFPGLTFAVEVCEDMWVPIPPHTKDALNGASVLVNISGSPINIGKARSRKLLAESASARCLAAYVFTAAGPGESSTDLSWDGQTFVYECGDLLGESDRFPTGPSGTIVDIDLRRITHERLRQGTFGDNRRNNHQVLDRDFYPYASLATSLIDAPRGDLGLLRPVDRFPFVPNDPARLAQDCYEAYNIQVFGLARRLEGIGPNTKAVIGVSGGLDSTHALIVAAKAMDTLGRPRTDVLAFTMPGFATTEHTRNNAEQLCRALGVSFEQIDIRPAANQMLADMGHPYSKGEEVYDVTFENVQAGLRYDYLFRLANQRGGIVVGTGDLSELALGWATYGVGDQMSHYNVNPGVPKTLIQHLIRWVITTEQFDSAVDRILEAVLDTEITPELIPTKPGEKPQSTAASIGPYELHDFTLFHMLRRGAGPARIAFLAEKAWADPTAGSWPPGFPEAERRGYTLPEIRHWLEVFIKRFFANQFKRSALPDGPKVTSGGALSPRGDWRMPSDVKPTAWLTELERDVPAD